MDAINSLISKYAYGAAAAAFAFGLIIGLPLLGWWLWPVQWTNAAPSDLTATYQREYIQLVADSFALNQNVELAKTRIKYLGSAAPNALQAALNSTQGADNLRIVNLAAAVGPEAVTGGSGVGGAPTNPLARVIGLAPYVCGVMVVVALLGGAVFFVLQRRGKSGPDRPPSLRQQTPQRQAAAASAAAPRTDFAAQPGEPPIVQFMTTYQAGDDLYDESFSIDSPAGDFLGECGVGISETIGVGDPKKVAALEVWLFDKNDIRTVTNVLMSEHTFRDDGIKSKLSAKGEPALAKAGDTLVLQTATLHVTARVVDMSYGTGPLPPNSYFDRITIELAAWQRAPEEQPVAAEA
ncbi:MAG: hypothetical protein HY260_07895 [Chloroflexi bacterium]|nr:hypothetical protein [Chloroflexota bacterium]